MQRKWRNQEGFTLIEMLIVVAIIAILIAVSIPLIGEALERTRIATDTANERAAKAEVLIAYMTGMEICAVGGNEKETFKAGWIYCYDNSTGKLVKVFNGTNPFKPEPYGQCKHCKGKYIFIWFDETDMSVKLKWEKSVVNGDSEFGKDMSHLQNTIN